MRVQIGVSTVGLWAAAGAQAAVLSLTPIDGSDSALGQRNADFPSTYVNTYADAGNGLASPPLANGCVAESNASGPVVVLTGFSDFSVERTDLINVRRSPLGGNTCYLTTVGYAATFVMDFAQFRNGRRINAFGFLWGSFDEYNSLELLDVNSQPLNIVGFGPSFFTGQQLADFTGATLYSNRYVNFRFGPAEEFRFAVVRTSNTAFEIDNVRIADDRFGPLSTIASDLTAAPEPLVVPEAGWSVIAPAMLLWLARRRAGRARA